MATREVMKQRKRARGAGPAARPGRKPDVPPRIGRKDLQDPDRDVKEPDRPAPGGEKKR